MYFKATFSVCPRLILWILLRENLGSDSVATEYFKNIFKCNYCVGSQTCQARFFCFGVRTLWASQVAQWIKNPPAIQEMQETWVRFLGQKDSPGGRHRNPLQYSCLENPMDRGAWQATVHIVKRSWTQLEQLDTHACMNSLAGVPGLSSWGTWVQNLWSMWDPSSLTRDRAYVPGTARRILNHWITREVPWVFSLRETSVR